MFYLSFFYREGSYRLPTKEFYMIFFFVCGGSVNLVAEIGVHSVNHQSVATHRQPL